MSDSIKTSFEKICSEAQKTSLKVELLISQSERLSLGAQKGELQKFESSIGQTAGFRVFNHGHWGYAFTENLSDESLLKTFLEASSNAQLLNSVPSDESGVLVKPQKIPDLNVFRPENIPMAEKIKIAHDLENQFLKMDPRIKNVPYSGFSEVSSSFRILNSEGVDHTFKQNYYTAAAYGLAKDNDSSKMDGESQFTRVFGEINAHEICEKGSKKAISRLNAKKLKTGNYPVVIYRDEFSTILQMISNYFSAKEVFEKKSLLAGKLNQKVASTKVNLIDDPLELRGSNIRPFDCEGAPSQKINLIENGILKNYLTDLKYSLKMTLPHTAHASRGPTTTSEIAPSNLILLNGSSTLEQLLNKYPKVVFLTEFSGSLHAGFKETTGDFSMPAEGFLYENGINQGPIEQFVISGNALDLFEKIEELGDTYNSIGSSKICPDVLISSLNFAGES